MIKQIPDTISLGRLSDAWVEELEAKVNRLTDWSDQRSSQYKVHRATSSVDVIQSPLTPGFFNEIERGRAYGEFESDIDEICGFLRGRYRFIDPKIVRFLMVNLPAGTSVDPHRDFGPGLMVGARIHLPLVTNEKVRFRVGQTDTSLRRGHLYEINNSKMHAVNNSSDQDRIHAIFDVCDMWHIEEQVQYAVAHGKDRGDGDNGSAAPTMVESSLRFCSGQIQERICQVAPPIHLFVLCPNNGGSTMLTQYLARCRAVANLPREGQFMKCFVGPNPVKLGVRHLFTELQEVFQDPAQYNFDNIKRGWCHHWESQPGTQIRLEKSPPNIVRAELLRLHFPNVRFILQVRNPYAMAEGIARRTETRDYRRIGRHVFRALQIQLENASKYKDMAVAVRYEDVCERPDKVRERLVAFLPQLSDLDFSEVIQIKDYHQPVSNLNEQQIGRLTREDVDQINESYDENVMTKLGYARL